MKWIKFTEDTVLSRDGFVFICVKGFGDISKVYSNCDWAITVDYPVGWDYPLPDFAERYHDNPCFGKCINIQNPANENYYIVKKEHILYYLEIPKDPITLEEELEEEKQKYHDSFLKNRGRGYQIRYYFGNDNTIHSERTEIEE